MSSYNFTAAEVKFISLIMRDPAVKIVCWEEYGPTEWYMYVAPLILKKVPLASRKIIKMMIKLELLVPEIENDKEYKVQRALGCVIGRIYHMPEEIREELKNVIMDM